MTELDQTTGLPPLPEGHWWEVRKYETSMSLGWSVGTRQDGYQVCVVKKKTIPAKSTPGKRWWSADIVTPERTSGEVVFNKQIEDPALIAKREDMKSDNFVYLSDTGKRHIEPADILKAALEIMEQIEEAKAAKERRDASDALIGAYPPKALAS